MLREKLQVNDVPGVLEALKAVESVSIDLIKGWSKANQMSRKLLEAFGEGNEESNA